ncbi:hypothetical protein L249_8404 [Ophiocordyceps polyrhachis-furcata BCC 54312]|uniref:Uncharacterized protein n=1 Tax=Ophiocordyceps polyrhachis-furcata BCC 54312 TaxID=1330021 RepID=A0A367L690_9HYPO|nr:hypothetical protein L249_8404 [Ophiocordyceps polyrhachis-furcata BCC 54312]
MDEAPLVEALRRKLDGLERSLENCRLRLLADFQQDCRFLLRDVPPDTAAQVRRAIAAVFANYPALRPELAAAESPPAAAFQPSPAVSGSPRERELELQGLFTPTYLPLLDSSPASCLAAPNLISPSPLERRVQGAAQEGMEEPMPSSSRPFVLPTPAADDATSSASSTTSDKSDSKPPRSALRRSPTMAKPPQSPRRVRFEFMGAEVLPTTSPQPSELVTRRPSSPKVDRGDDDDDGENGDDDTTAFVSNLAGDTTEEEPTIPRKVSSSDALRALSRTPLEEGVVWTVVNADTDDSAVTQDGKDATSPPSAASEAESPVASLNVGAPKIIAPESTDHGDSDSDADSDSGFLAMAGAKSHRNRPLQAPVSVTGPSFSPSPDDGARPATPTNKQLSSAHVVEEAGRALSRDDVEVEDDEDVFHFETAGLSMSSKSGRRSSWREEKATQPEPDDDGSDATSVQVSDGQFGIYATSPAVPIRQPRKSRSSDPSVKFRPGSVGSYKGQPLMMPIVRDPEVLERALSNDSPVVRECDLDDRTAMEEGSPPRFPSTPFSFSERFMMEEAMERMKSNKDEEWFEEGWDVEMGSITPVNGSLCMANLRFTRGLVFGVIWEE